MKERERGEGEKEEGRGKKRGGGGGGRKSALLITPTYILSITFALSSHYKSIDLFLYNINIVAAMINIFWA